MYRNSNKIKIVICILFITNFSKAQSKLIEVIHFNVGLTAYKNQFYNNGLNNDFPLLCKGPNVGIDLYNNKLKIGFEFRKTLWLFISPSNLSTVSGTGNYDYLGVYKNIETKKHKIFQISLGYSFIRENGYRIVSYSYIRPNPRSTVSFIPLRGSFNTYTSEAITLGVGYYLTKHLFIDLRANCYVKSYNSFFKLGLNENRLMLSLIYKLNKK